eukprot:scaffold34996_cov16-Prasinocladus_malaysianus.AAC.1
MKADGLQPTVFTYNVAINACGKAQQPLRAKQVIDEMMPAAGLEGLKPNLPEMKEKKRKERKESEVKDKTKRKEKERKEK